MKSRIEMIREIISRIRHSLELGKYDRFTIAEYFRKQGVQIGEGCCIIPTSLGMEPYLIKFGNHVTIAQGVHFVTHDGGTWILRNEFPNIQGFGPIVIEDNCVIGMNAILFPNVRIGRNSIVGAGSVVISDIPPNTIALGVPARPFGSTVKYKQKCLEQWERQQPTDCIIEPGKNWWNSENFDKNREKLKRHLLELFKQELKLDCADHQGK